MVYWAADDLQHDGSWLIASTLLHAMLGSHCSIPLLLYVVLHFYYNYNIPLYCSITAFTIPPSFLEVKDLKLVQQFVFIRIVYN
jgi:hypothetical protein